MRKLLRDLRVISPPRAPEANSHSRIVRSAPAFGRHPGDILGRVLDVAGLAVNAVLRVDHEAGAGLRGFILIDHLIDRGGTIEPRGFPIAGQFSRIGIDGSASTRWGGWSSS